MNVEFAGMTFSRDRSNRIFDLGVKLTMKKQTKRHQDNGNKNCWQVKVYWPKVCLIYSMLTLLSLKLFNAHFKTRETTKKCGNQRTNEPTTTWLNQRQPVVMQSPGMGSLGVRVCSEWVGVFRGGWRTSDVMRTKIWGMLVWGWIFCLQKSWFIGFIYMFWVNFGKFWGLGWGEVWTNESTGRILVLGWRGWR